MIREYAVVALITMTTLAAGAATIFGRTTCAQWTNDNSSSRQAWLLGFMSGLSMKHAEIRDHDPLAKAGSADQIFRWVDNYCRANPLKTVAQAGDALFDELEFRR